MYNLVRRSGLLWTGHADWLMRLSGNCALYFTYASVLSLAVVSLERMYAVLWPLKHRRLTTRSYRVMMGATWLLAALYVSPIVALKSLDALQTSKAINVVNFTTTISLLLIIITSYLSIWVKIKFFTLPQHHASSAQNRHMTMSLFLVAAASVTTWFCAAVLLNAVCYPVCNWWKTRSVHIYIFNAATLLLSANSLVNPVIYALKLPQFRRAVTRLVFRRTGASTQPRLARRPRDEQTGNQRGHTTDPASELPFETRWSNAAGTQLAARPGLEEQSTRAKQHGTRI